MTREVFRADCSLPSAICVDEQMLSWLPATTLIHVEREIIHYAYIAECFRRAVMSTMPRWVLGKPFLHITIWWSRVPADCEVLLSPWLGLGLRLD